MLQHCFRKGGFQMNYTALTPGIIGTVNRRLIGFFRLDLVSLLFGNMTSKELLQFLQQLCLCSFLAL